MIHVLAHELDAGLESLIRLRFVLLDALLERLKDYKTKRLDERALEQRLTEVNSLTYKPRPQLHSASLRRSGSGTFSANTNAKPNRPIAPA